MISQAADEINKIPRHRIDQVVRSGGAEIERVAPKNYQRCYRRGIQNTFQTTWKFRQETIPKNKKKTI